MTRSAGLLTVRLKVPGLWRDVWLYKDKLYLWDRQGVLHYAAMEVVQQQIGKIYGPGAALLAQYLIFRNDWKNGKSLRSMLALPEIESSFLRPFSRESSESMEFEVPVGLFKQSPSDSYPGTVLDTCVFANRVYLGTSDGLLESYIHPRYPDRRYSVEQQLDRRINELAIRYAAINASAEDDGLHFGRVHFNQSSSDSDDWIGFRPSKFVQIADVSYSVAHVGRDILNYTDSAAPTYLKARVERATHESARYDDQNVIGYEQPRDIYRATQQALNPGASSGGDVVVVGNSGTFLLAAAGRALRVISLKTHNSDEPSMSRNRQFHADMRWFNSVDDILRTYSVNGGFVIESEDCVRLMTKDGSYRLLDGEAARIRTYRASLRYKEVVSVVQEDSLSVFGYYEKADTLF